MISREQYEQVKGKVLAYYKNAGIVLTEDEQNHLEVADFGLNDIENSALQLVIYVNTDRVCAKEMVLLPGQVCPEHRHPAFGDYPGKEETFRCRAGRVYLYIDGPATDARALTPPENGAEYYTVFHEIMLEPGEQYTIPINTKHWFGAGEEGAVVSEFSTPSYDDEDVFTDPRIQRAPVIAEEG